MEIQELRSEEVNTRYTSDRDQQPSSVVITEKEAFLVGRARHRGVSLVINSFFIAADRRKSTRHSLARC